MTFYFLPHIHWEPLIVSHGYWLVFCVIALESAGIPFPGEALLLTAAAYSGHTHKLDIAAIVAVAATAGSVGSLCGFAIGHWAGLPLLHRYGRWVGLDERRLRLGAYIFDRHGGKIVFFGRQVAVLRAFSGLLAGSNGMELGRFLFFSITGAIAWAGSLGAAAYVYGRAVHDILGPLGLAMMILGAGAVVGGWIFLRRHEATLQARADKAAGL